MYWLLVICIVVPSIIFIYSKNKSQMQLKYGSKIVQINNEKIFFVITLLMLWILLILKSVNTGVDTKTYIHMYSQAKYYFIHGVNWNLLSQPLYYLTFGILEMMGIPFKTTQAIIYLFAIISLYHFIKQYAQNKLLPCFFFVVGEAFWFYMSGIRQTIAISIGLFAIDSLIKKKTLLSFSLIIVAIMYHKSAFILFVILIFKFWIPTIRQLFFIWLVGIIGAFIIPENILIWAANLLGFSQYEEFFGISTHPLLLLVYVSVGAFCFLVIFGNKKVSEQEIILMAMMAIGTMLMSYSIKFYLLGRLFYYFQIPIYVVLSNSICRLKSKKNFILGLLVIACFIGYFAVANSPNILQTVPYEFYWEAGEEWV